MLQVFNFLRLRTLIFCTCANTGLLDCSQSPYFSVGFSRLVRFDGAAAILVCKSERDLGRVSKLPWGGERSWEAAGKIFFRCPSLTQLTPTPAPLGSLDTPQIALAFANQDGGSSIEAYQSRESHGKIGGLWTVYGSLDSVGSSTRENFVSNTRHRTSFNNYHRNVINNDLH